MQRDRWTAAALSGAITGLRARQTLPEGAILTKTNVDVAPALSSGDRVTLHLISGSIRRSVPGIAKRSGRPGDMIAIFHAIRAAGALQAEILSQ